jgi:homoserine O-acetyltransferase/O-succinyltransferase
MTKRPSTALQALFGLLVLLAAVTVHADGAGLLTTKQVFTLPAYTTVGGETIRDVRLGYETYGRLNAAGDNAIFVAHYYSGTSHAAGRYAPDDAAPGYWDAIIGPGKTIDTNRWFVISADTFANLNVGDPRVVTTGPASIDPATGRPYALRFPVVSLRDSVRVHRLLVDSLGVKKLAAAIGASGGSIQAMEWAALYPAFVERVVHVIGPGFAINPWVIGLADLWTTPIRLDPNWNGGDYYGRTPPSAGLAQALKLVTLTGRHWGWAARTYGHAPGKAGPGPQASIASEFRIVESLNDVGAGRAALLDANSMFYMSRAAALYRLTDAEIDGIRAKILFVPASSDLLFPPELSTQALERFRARGGRGELFVLQGDGGHLDGVFEIAQAAPTIRRFLTTD